MKQILDYLKIEKLGATVLPPFEKFEGLMAAKVSRRNSENFVVAKWNDDFLTPDVAFDPNANFGMVDEFLELYSNEESEGLEMDLVNESDDENAPEDELPLDLELVNANEELGGEALEINIETADKLITWVDAGLKHDEFEIGIDLAKEGSESVSVEFFPIFETLKGDELSEWLLSHRISHKSTLSKPEKVKICEKYVADLAKSE